MKMVVFLGLMVVASGALADRTESQVLRDMKKAAHSAELSYKQSGVNGLIIDTEECYSKAKDKRYCIYLDAASTIVENTMSSNIGAPSNEFFSGDNFYGRAKTVALNFSNDETAISGYLRDVLSAERQLLISQ